MKSYQLGSHLACLFFVPIVTGVFFIPKRVYYLYNVMLSARKKKKIHASLLSISFVSPPYIQENETTLKCSHINFTSQGISSWIMPKVEQYIKSTGTRKFLLKMNKNIQHIFCNYSKEYLYSLQSNLRNKCRRYAEYFYSFLKEISLSPLT